MEETFRDSGVINRVGQIIARRSRLEIVRHLHREQQPLRPGSLLLMGSALIGLGGIRRFRRRRPEES